MNIPFAAIQKRILKVKIVKKTVEISASLHIHDAQAKGTQHKTMVK